MKNGQTKVPMIPGMIFDNFQECNKKKSQKFVVSQGIMLEKDRPVLEEIDPQSIKNLYLPMVTSQQLQNKLVDEKFSQQ